MASRPYVRRGIAARPQVPRRSAGSHRSHRQPARQRGQVGARAGFDSRRRARSASDQDPAPFLIAQIDDDGPGLDRSARAEAIERGKRLDKSRPGSGLGLSIVVDLASIYGGSLDARRKPARRLAGDLEAAEPVTRNSAIGRSAGEGGYDAADASCDACARAVRPCRLFKRWLGRRAAAGRGSSGRNRPLRRFQPARRSAACLAGRSAHR